VNKVEQPYGPEETVRRAEALYAERIGADVEPGHTGEYVVIDVDTGEYRVGMDYDAISRDILLAKPGAALGALRIGHATLGRIGGRVRVRRT
jgi:hypothetical protein